MLPEIWSTVFTQALATELLAEQAALEAELSNRHDPSRLAIFRQYLEQVSGVAGEGHADDGLRLKPRKTGELLGERCRKGSVDIGSK